MLPIQSITIKPKWTHNTNQPLSLGVNLLSREGNSQDGRMKGEKSQKDKRIWREASEVRALFTNSLASFVLFSLFIRSCVLCFSFLLSFSSCFTSLPLQLNERKKRSTMTQQVLQIEDLLCVFFVLLFGSFIMDWTKWGKHEMNQRKKRKKRNTNERLDQEVKCDLFLSPFPFIWLIYNVVRKEERNESMKWAKGNENERKKKQTTLHFLGRQSWFVSCLVLFLLFNSRFIPLPL